MRRFEYTDAKSDKFWEIAVDGNTYTVRYGRKGTDGQTNTKVFDSPEQAMKKAESAIQSKTRKGYVEVEAQAAPVGEAEAFEAAIRADPSSESWSVYADWLQSRDDARGELVNVAVALAANPDDSALRARHEELISTHAREWLGPFAPDADYGQHNEIRWANGFWRSARIWVDWDIQEAGLFPKMLGAILRHPSAAFLEELSLGLADAEGENYYEGALASLVKHGKRPGLRTLHVGSFEYPDETEISWTEVGDFGSCWSVLPDLESLTLTGGSIGLGTPKAPKLQHLKLETGGLPKQPVEALSKASLPALERLEIWFGQDNYGAECGPEEVRALLANTSGMPKLTSLGLKNSEFHDDLVPEVIRGPLVEQLEVLDLGMGTLTDTGAQALLDGADALKHLKTLDVSECFLSPEMIERLKATFAHVVAAEQREPWDWDDEPHYYSAVGE
jgi:uncharacterized protein (TIGR02996 family)